MSQLGKNFIHLINFSKVQQTSYFCNVQRNDMLSKIFVWEGWTFEWIFPRILTNLSMPCCQGQQGMTCRSLFIKFTANF